MAQATRKQKESYFKEWFRDCLGDQVKPGFDERWDAKLAVYTDEEMDSVYDNIRGIG